MIPLEDPRWKEFEGGYRVKYDASIPLRKLELTTDKQVYQSILEELFQELYHQDDVGMASYMAVPHLIRIEKEKSLGDWRILRLIASIEVARENNPPLDKEFEKPYLESLLGLIDIVHQNKKEDWNRTYTSCALAAIAVAKGALDMARIIFELENSELAQQFEKFLEQY